MFASKYAKRKNPSPEDTGISLWSRLTFSWLSSLLAYGYENILEQEDVFDTPAPIRAQALHERVEKYREKQKQKQKTRLGYLNFWKTICRVFTYELFVYPGILKLITTVLTFITPLVLHELIEYIQNLQSRKRAKPNWYGYTLIALLLVCPILRSVSLHQYMYWSHRMWCQVRSTLQTEIFRKMLRLSVVAKQKYRTGEIVNLMSLDSNRVAEALSWIHFSWEAPLIIIVASLLIYQYLGWASFVGIGGMVIMLPMAGIIARFYGKANDELLKYKDERTKMVSEVLQGIRVIKYFAWEKRFKSLIEKIRKKEYKSILKASMLENTQNFVTTLIPIIGSTVTFSVFVLNGGELTTAKVFASLALFNIVEWPLYSSSYWISSYINAYVSGRRINNFFASDEVEENVLKLPTYSTLEQKKSKKIEKMPRSERVSKKEAKWAHTKEEMERLLKSPVLSESYRSTEVYDDEIFADIKENLAIRIKDGTFSWDKDPENPTLRDINLKIKKGQLVCVIGSVATGKSSLLAAIFGDIPKLKGSVRVYGKIAYCAQVPWIVNATVRDNILFGKEYDERKYNEVVRACQLTKDFELLSYGDLTEIGDQGINLSGGQKHRVSLARACYSDADILLLDSPLAAVDAQVAKKIFRHCIRKYLKGKTVILCTHSLQFLPRADLILVMKDGRISEYGKYRELLSVGCDLRTLLKSTAVDHDATADFIEGEVDEQLPLRSEEEDEDEYEEGEIGRLTTIEETGFETVAWSVYKFYFGGYGLILLIFCFIFGIVSKLTHFGSGLWMSAWSIDRFDLSLYWYLGIYIAFGIGYALTDYICTVSFTFGNLRSANRMHDSMLARMLRAPIRFFDQTPVGRILNRFSRDQLIVDFEISFVIYYLWTFILDVIIILIMVCIITPPTFLVIIPVGILYYFAQRYYRRTYRQLKRLESVSRSPVYSQFSSCITGVSTIRAYELKDLFCHENDYKIDENMKSFWHIMLINRWLSLRLESLSSFVVFGTALFGLLLRNYIDPSLVAFSVTYSLNISESFNWLIRMLVQVEAGMISVERIAQYTKVPQEAPPIIEKYRPPPNWPDKGEIIFDNICMRYRPNLELVLKGVSFKVNPGEFIGIVGRTGSGKSSLLQVLFRMVEFEMGSIIVDGIDISKIGLEDLRSRLCIVPQDPTVFTGTLRSNLDPFNQYSDHEIWEALENCHLKSIVEKLPNKLDEPIIEAGQNLSVGEKQLLCLCRPLLQKSKIVVLDEATANIDVESDRVIQQTIRESFKDTTILTIAHRLDTIVDADRVLVMKEGRVLEFDNPLDLMNDPTSAFAKLVKETGEAYGLYLKSISEKKFGKRPRKGIPAIQEPIEVEHPQPIDKSLGQSLSQPLSQTMRQSMGQYMESVP